MDSAKNGSWIIPFKKFGRIRVNIHVWKNNYKNYKKKHHTARRGIKNTTAY